MNYKKSFLEYLNKSKEIISKGDSRLTDFLAGIKKEYLSEEQRSENSDILISIFYVLLKDKMDCEKKLKDVNNSYDEVLGMITHEFKNILTSIHGYNMLLEKRLENAKDMEAVNHFRDSDRLTRQLFAMTDSLLKMSLGEKGLIKPELKLVDFITDIINPIKKDLLGLLNKKSMKIILNHRTKSLVVECDEGLMDIVVRNLLLNAVNYGKQNSDIIVNIERTKNAFSVAIKNFSDDIPEDLCKGIFEKFKSRKIGSEKGGTGIGLYNVRNIVHLHQGKIFCQCSAKQWVEFKFKIPQNI